MSELARAGEQRLGAIGNAGHAGAVLVQHTEAVAGRAVAPVAGCAVQASGLAVILCDAVTTGVQLCQLETAGRLARVAGLIVQLGSPLDFCGTPAPTAYNRPSSAQPSADSPLQARSSSAAARSGSTPLRAWSAPACAQPSSRSPSQAR